MGIRNDFKEAFKKHLGITRILDVWNNDLKYRGAMVRDAFMMADESHGMKLYTDVAPIMRNEKFESVLAKYIKMYPEEVTEFTRQMNDYKGMLDDEKGFSKSRTQRLTCKLPETLGQIIQEYFPDYLEDKKGLHKLQQMIPKCFVGNI